MIVLKVSLMNKYFCFRYNIFGDERFSVKIQVSVPDLRSSMVLKMSWVLHLWNNKLRKKTGKMEDMENRRTGPN